MARLSKVDRDRVARWLYENDTMLWWLGSSRLAVCAMLGKMGIQIDSRQLRTLVAVAPCTRWHGRRRPLDTGPAALTSTQWARVDHAIRVECRRLTTALRNPLTLARSLGEEHAIHVSPEVVTVSLAYKALVKGGMAADSSEHWALGDLPG